MSKIEFIDLSEYFGGEFRFAWIISGGCWVTHFWEPKHSVYGISTPIFTSWEHFEMDYSGNKIEGIPLSDFRAAFPTEHMVDEYAVVREMSLILGDKTRASYFHDEPIVVINPKWLQRVAKQLIELNNWLDTRKPTEPLDLGPVREFASDMDEYFWKSTGNAEINMKYGDARNAILGWLNEQGVEK